MTADRHGLRWMRAVERFLFVVAALALAWFAVAHLDAMREQAALSAELERGSALVASGGGVSRHVARPAPRALVGRIEVARLHLSALAREGVDTGTLRGSAGHVPGTALPGERGNAAFAAHRDTFFRPLKGVERGDEITVTTPAARYRYVVLGTRIVDPDEVTILDATPDATLTLVTCYPFEFIGSAPRRFVVRARLVEAKRRV